MEKLSETQLENEECTNHSNVLENMPNFEEFRAQQQNDLLEKEDKNSFYDELLYRLDTTRKEILSQRKPIEEEVSPEIIESFNAKYQQYLEQISKVNKETRDSACREIASQVFQALESEEISYLYKQAGRLELHDEIENEKEQYEDLMRLLKVDWNKFLFSPELRDCDDAKRNEEKRIRVVVLEKMSPEELKILREQHAKYVLDGDDPIPYTDENGEYDYDIFDKNEEIKHLWDMDEGWLESDEYHRCISEHPILRHPEIYVHPDQERISEHIDEIMAKISDNALRKIYISSKNYEDGVRRIVKYLTNIFQLEKQPKIEFDDESLIKIGARGGYQDHKHTILVKSDKGAKRPLNLDDINVISHEMWHAYQHMIARKNPEKAELGSFAFIYKYNFENYITAKENYGDVEGTWVNNINQFVEIEARVFGTRFTEKFEEACNKQNLDKNDDVITKLLKMVRNKKDEESK